jgi:hypothetical protein
VPDYQPAKEGLKRIEVKWKAVPAR